MIYRILYCLLSGPFSVVYIKSEPYEIPTTGNRMFVSSLLGNVLFPFDHILTTDSEHSVDEEHSSRISHEKVISLEETSPPSTTFISNVNSEENASEVNDRDRSDDDQSISNEESFEQPVDADSISATPVSTEFRSMSATIYPTPSLQHSTEVKDKLIFKRRDPNRSHRTPYNDILLNINCKKPSVPANTSTFHQPHTLSYFHDGVLRSDQPVHTQPCTSGLLLA